MTGNMVQILLVAAGGATGAVTRFGLGIILAPVLPGPWPTFVVNILGSLVIGLVIGAMAGSDWFETWGRFLLVTGLLGGFTTYSAFAIDAVVLMSQGRLIAAMMYVVATALGCIFAAWFGVRLAGG